MDVNETATDSSMQDISDKLEDRMFGSNDPGEEQPVDDEVIDDDQTDLPEDNDSDSDEEGSDDLVDEDLSLAEYLGLDNDRIKEDDNGDLVFDAIIDGETKQVPLKDLAASYQLQGHVNNKSIALETARKDFEATRQSIATQMEQRVQGIESLTKTLEDDLVSEYNSIDWDALRVQNPAEWTALRQEYADKANRIQKAQGLASEERNRILEEQQAIAKQEHAKHIEKEYEKVLADNPKWVDESVRIAEQAEIKDFLTSSYGFTEQEFAMVTDSRLVKLIQDAKKYKLSSKQAESKKEKVVPKFRKPTNAKANSNQLAKARSVKAKKAKVKASNGNPKDIADLILDRM